MTFINSNGTSEILIMLTLKKVLTKKKITTPEVDIDKFLINKNYKETTETKLLQVQFENQVNRKVESRKEEARLKLKQAHVC